jgi:hypothetical protein
MFFYIKIQLYKIQKNEDMLQIIYVKSPTHRVAYIVRNRLKFHFRTSFVILNKVKLVYKEILGHLIFFLRFRIAFYHKYFFLD